jgi:hypothetical protein
MIENPGRKPTVKQVYAIAFELCERAGEQFPDTVAEASELIERLRLENGKTIERREEVVPGRGDEGGASTVLA